MDVGAERLRGKGSGTTTAGSTVQAKGADAVQDKGADAVHDKGADAVLVVASGGGDYGGEYLYSLRPCTTTGTGGRECVVGRSISPQWGSVRHHPAPRTCAPWGMRVVS